MLSVVALGAVCEMEELAGPPRQPTLDALGYVAPRNEEAESLAQHKELRKQTAGDSFTTRDMLLSPTRTSKQRQGMVDSGNPHFYLEEYADLSDGRRVMLNDDRGWSSWPLNRFDSRWKTAVGRALTRDTIWVLDPDEVDTNDVWEGWVVERSRFLGVEVDPTSVHAAPFHVEFGPRVQHELRQPNSELDVIPESGASGPTIEVITFGAVCELDYSTDPVWSPASSGGYVFHELPYHVDWPDELLQAQRREMTEWGIREFRIQEFADLSDGRRVILKDDRCWDFWPLNEPGSRWKFANGRELTRQTISMLEPADSEQWFGWMMQRLDSGGVDVDPASAHAAPFKVEFGRNVQHELQQREPAV